MFRPMPLLFVLSVLVLLASSIQAADLPKEDVPKPLPKEVVATWKKAGMALGWCEVRGDGFLAFYLANKKPKAGWLPAFRPAPWREGVLKDLTEPATAFALDLTAR